MRRSLKRNMFILLLVVLAVFSGVVGLFLLELEKRSEHDIRNQEQIVALNEIEKLTEKNGISPAKKQIEEFRQQLDTNNGNQQYKTEKRWLFMIWFFSVIGMCSLYFVMYWNVLRPFEKLEKYAEEIALGNLEIHLDYSRGSPFGAFTWAFDHMRREILKARICEQEAIEKNKTVIATLSHDIKTPVSSIRAYAEGLEANMDSTPQRRQRYLSVIMKKCDQVTQLTNDLLLHSLTDLDKLQIQWETVEMRSFLQQALQELSGKKGDLVLESEIVSARLQADGKRLAQVLDNIVGNARKYAQGTWIYFWTVKKENFYEIHIKDEGNGILPEDMPFVFEKFYRGKNAKDESGAGLGLYIVKYIMTQMGGEVRLINSGAGLEVVLEFDLLKTS